jgi:hypothetical protein
MLEQVPPCDVMNLHWVSGYLDYEQFFPAASQRAPIVWTLHDMNAMTGESRFCIAVYSGVLPVREILAGIRDQRGYDEATEGPSPLAAGAVQNVDGPSQPIE